MNAIYLVLDMQNDLINPAAGVPLSPLAQQARSRDIVARTADAIGAARGAGIAIGFVRVGFSSDYHECPKDSPIFSGAPAAGLFRLGARGAELHADLGARDTDVHVIKHRVSPFYATTLMAQIRAMRIERIYCSGVSTQAVVQATVRDAHDRDFDVVLLEDCCAAHSAEEHANSIQSLSRFCRVVNSRDDVFGATA